MRTQPLKTSGDSDVNFSFGLARSSAFVSSSSSKTANCSSAKMIVSSVYIPTTPNLSVVDIKKHGSYVDVVINSLSLWRLLYVAH